MATFLKGSGINTELENIFEEANKQLLLISPFIKLHPKLIDILKTKIENHKLEITLVFGKNEDDISKSLRREDFIFLKEFPNIEIKYEQRLHAKYYANESSALLSSMNLYEFSQNNNIEFGILTKSNILTKFTQGIVNEIDKDAFKFFKDVISNAKTLFEKKPVYKGKMLGLSQNYTHSTLAKDELSAFYGIDAKDYTSPVKTNSKYNEPYSKKAKCIRCKTQIPLNMDKPLCSSCYNSWAQYGNPAYQEQVCHSCGKNEYTSMAKPLCRNCFKEHS
jgi:hypothetical protein